MTDPTAIANTYAIQSITVDQIRPSSHQVRKDFDEGGIKVLAESIEKEGLIQPVTVRAHGDGYELVAGERRLRAVKLLAWTKIDARVIQPVSEGEAAAKGLIENIQRQDLNPIEEAEGFSTLNKLDSVYWTHDKIGEVAGKDRTYVTKSIALLTLPESVQADVRRRTLSRDHGIELLRLSNGNSQKSMALKIAKGGLSAKKTRALIDAILVSKGVKKPTSASDKEPDPLEAIWPELAVNFFIGPAGSWKPVYQGKKKWSFTVEVLDEDSRAGLASWFTHMGQGLKGDERAADETVKAMDAVVSAQEQEDAHAWLPSTPQEEKDLLAQAQQSAQAFYTKVYGAGSGTAQRVGSLTWEQMGVDDPAEECRNIIESLRGKKGIKGLRAAGDLNGG